MGFIDDFQATAEIGYQLWLLRESGTGFGVSLVYTFSYLMTINKPS